MGFPPVLYSNDYKNAKKRKAGFPASCYRLAVLQCVRRSCTCGFGLSWSFLCCNTGKGGGSFVAPATEAGLKLILPYPVSVDVVDASFGAAEYYPAGYLSQDTGGFCFSVLKCCVLGLEFYF